MDSVINCIIIRFVQVMVFFVLLAITSGSFATQIVNNASVESYQLKNSPVQDSFFSRLNPRRASILLQGGGYVTTTGHAQNVDIAELVNDYFTVNHYHARNGMVGIGYYIDGVDNERYKLLFGLNAFYFGRTSVQGTIVQEEVFTNLAYRYSLTNYPVFLATKALIKNNNDKYNITLDVGIGPNLVKTTHFTETSLDGGITVPDDIFAGQSRIVFSGMAGFGIRFNNIVKHIPLEIGYRFFYLGQGTFKKLNGQVTSRLTSGDSFANSLIFTIAI
jgi:hypothetical protein